MEMILNPWLYNANRYKRQDIVFVGRIRRDLVCRMALTSGALETVQQIAATNAVQC